MKKSTILLVHNEYQNPGGEDVVFEQERALLENHGHSVPVYWRSNHEIAKLTQLGRAALPVRAVWAGDSRREMALLLAREKPDVVHVHNTFMMISPSIFSACREAKVPVVQTLHNYRLACPAANFFRDGKVCEECVEFGPWRSLRYACYRGSRAATAGSALVLEVHRRLRTWTEKVDGFIALAEFARQRFIAAGLPAERIHVKPNFVDPDPGAAVEKGDYAISVGRFSTEKGLWTLLAAWQLLGMSIPLHIVGDGPLRGELEREAGKRGLTDVVFRGRLSRGETAEEMRRARVLIHPSECYENFPMAIAEAFACATPVICSRLGAMQEIVTDGQTGLLFAPGDPVDLARQVRHLWERPPLREDMGRRARLEYKARYTAEQNYSRLMEIYAAAAARTMARQFAAATA